MISNKNGNWTKLAKKDIQFNERKVKWVTRFQCLYNVYTNTHLQIKQWEKQDEWVNTEFKCFTLLFRFIRMIPENNIFVQQQMCDACHQMMVMP